MMLKRRERAVSLIAIRLDTISLGFRGEGSTRLSSYNSGTSWHRYAAGRETKCGAQTCLLPQARNTANAVAIAIRASQD